MCKIFSKLIGIIFFAQLKVNASPVYFWGDKIDVANHDVVRFLVLTEYKTDELSLITEGYGGFECNTSIRQVEEGKVQVSVFWSPGADTSGCCIKLFAIDGKNLGTSILYMNY